MNAIDLTINGQKLNFSFGLGFLGEIIDKTGLDLDELNAKLSSNAFKYIPLVMFYSAEYSKKRIGESLDFTQYDMADWIEQEEGAFSSDVVLKFFDGFTKSLTKDIPKSKPSKSTGKEKK
tara:strand:- start:6860 stop:7219 length:360 start_codon:yes stop_codon:yes gene_type:complete